MLKKRFIGVITVKDGFAVQSFGYNQYLPIGNPVVVAENLDRWGVDEIIVLSIDRSIKGLGPDFELLNALCKLPLSTPLTYGGGIHNVEQASAVIRTGAERICLDTALHGNLDVLYEISSHIGSQAVLASMPLSIEAGQLYWYNHVDRTQLVADGAISGVFRNGLVSEALIIDWKNEGMRNGFDLDLLRHTSIPDAPLIAFGGLSEIVKIDEAFSMSHVVGVGVGNFLHYSEHSVQKYKEHLECTALRLPKYQLPLNR